MASQSMNTKSYTSGVMVPTVSSEKISKAIKVNIVTTYISYILEVSAGTPVKSSYFDNKDIKVHSVSAGLRHSVIVDTEGKVYCFGDNSLGQLGTSELRQYAPFCVKTDFRSLAVFSGLNHNLIKTKDGRIYKWGGDSKYKGSDTKNTSAFKYMYEFKGKRTSNIQTAQNNTVVVSHLKIIKDDTMPDTN